ncbi:MAG: hypothetical protein K5770_05665, partial [Lachnospiraceae bacterium]|nr:hypothetical protein [Lachnospiraceae bacterium]
MAMRITNGIMNSNAKINIMINKEYADRTNTMVATGQKITRPSDDPVIAIRNLRLNSNIDELTQYKTKNIPDADAWLKTTGTALDQTHQVLQNIHDNLTTGASDQHTADDRMKIMENLTKLRDQVYASGNADYAGRTVFTGYRTGETLTYLEPEDKNLYNIYETFENSAVTTMPYVKGNFDIYKAAGSGQVINPDVDEDTVQQYDIFRVRLAYDNLQYDSGNMTDVDGGNLNVNINYKLKDGTEGSLSPEIVTLKGKSQEEIDDIYSEYYQTDAALADTEPKVRLIADTGELILNKAAADLLRSDKAEFNIEYAKSDFKRGDLRPEHYFACKSKDTTDSQANVIEYNYSDTHKPDFQRQRLSYEVSFNQTMEINTNACDVFTHDIGRDVDDLMKATQAVIDVEKKIENLKKAIKEENPNITDEELKRDIRVKEAEQQFSYL